MSAMIAAISLHALPLFLLSPHRQALLLPPEGALQVELLARQHTSAIRPSANMQPAAIAPRVKTHKPALLATVQPHPQPVARHLVQQPVITVAASSRAVPVPSRVAILQATQPSHKAAKKTDRAPIATTGKHAPARAAAASLSGVIAVPPSVVQSILAQVYYPMQARRHGWQGRAEFELAVNQQMIHTITLLASSGYPILDRAAQRGLASVHQIPLSNGLYRMPVVFQLQ